MRVRELPKETRPREKAIELGIKTLSDVELLALILRSGYQGKSVLNLAKDILEKFPLDELPRVDVESLMSIKGIKHAKALDLLACFEISRRSNLKRGKTKDVINDPHALYEFIKSEIGSLDNEHFLVVCLNTKNQVIDYKIMFIGTVDMAIVHPRDVFKYAIENNATSVICAHNHPSSDISPSKQDIHITKVLKQTGELVGIKLIDHLVVSSKEIYSILSQI